LAFGQSTQEPLQVGIWSQSISVDSEASDGIEGVPKRWVYPEPYLWFAPSTVEDDEALALSMDRYHQVTDQLYLLSPNRPRLRTFELWSRDGITLEGDDSSIILRPPTLNPVDHSAWIVSFVDFETALRALEVGTLEGEIWIGSWPDVELSDILTMLESLRESSVTSIWMEQSLYKEILSAEPSLSAIFRDWSIGQRTAIPFADERSSVTPPRQPAFIWVIVFIVFALFLQRQKYYSQRLYRTFVNGRAGETLRNSRNLREGRWSVLWMLAAVLFISSIIPLWFTDGFSAQVVHGWMSAGVLPYPINNYWLGLGFWFPIIFCWVGFQWLLIYISSHQPSLSDSSSILGWMEHLHGVWWIGWVLLYGLGMLDQRIGWILGGTVGFQTIFGVVAIWNMTCPGQHVVVVKSMLWSLLSVGLPSFILLLFLQSSDGQIGLLMAELLS
tara:strand:- start:7578 stop:8906 length:1329 start_codon:yes stop_codon:yes gene_type:complete